MPNSTLPPTVAAPGCVEARRRHRGRSTGSHHNCPTSAACRPSPSRASQRSGTIGRLSNTPPPLEPSIRRALSRLYDELRDSDKALSAAKLSSFVKGEQNETDASCLKQIFPGSTYSFTEFCDFWYEHISHSKRPVEKEDFNKPISNYFISSSHNTYIERGDQVSGVITTEQYRKVSDIPKRCTGAHTWLTNTEVYRSSETDAGV